MAPSGIVLVVDEKGNELIAQNADRPFAPASVTKIVTAWLAMQVLGGDYRFETKFYLDKNRVLYVRGGGDPFLVSEELAPLAQRAGRRHRQGAAHRHRARRELLPARHPHSGHREHHRVLRRAELRTRRELQHHRRRAQRHQGPLGREPDPDHPDRDQRVQGAGPQRSRPHQPEQRPRGELAIRGRADRRLHREGRRQRERQDLDRNGARGSEAGLRSQVAPPFADPRPAAHRLEQLHRQSGVPGDRRYAGRIRQPREVAEGGERDARRQRPR